VVTGLGGRESFSEGCCTNGWSLAWAVGRSLISNKVTFTCRKLILAAGSCSCGLGGKNLNISFKGLGT